MDVSPESHKRQSASLPSISMLDAKRADSVTSMPSFPMSAPTTFSQFDSATSTSAPLPPGLISPPGSRRTSGDEMEQRPTLPKISLPSIHETLRSETPSSYTVQPPPPAPSFYQPQQQSQQSPDLGRLQYASEQGPPPPPPPAPAVSNGYSPHTTSPYARRADVVPPPPAVPYSQTEHPPPTLSSASRLPSIHPFQGSSPVDTPRYPHSQHSQLPQQSSPRYDLSPPYPSQPALPTSGYSSNQHYTYAPPPTSVPPHVAYGRASQPIAPPPPPIHHGIEERKRSSLPPGQAYGESVKHHLETFDYETSLNEVADTTTQLRGFADQYRRLAHQTQRSGLLPGSSPSVSEIDEMLRKAQMMQDALRRIKDVVVAQNVAASEQQQQQHQQQQQQSQQHMAHDDRFKSQNGFHAGGAEQHGEYQDDAKAAGFAGPDHKKRRGRAAPPGRCHSCNRAETPEWRRGPDGARTLCNACGLHYAKLTRKMGGPNKQPVSGSNLRPKEPDSPSL